jgi:hypothetical protein
MGDTRNIKVTYPEDLELAELILSRRNVAKISRRDAEAQRKPRSKGRKAGRKR